MTIDSYHFGEVIVDGKKYTSDMIIFPDRIQSGWWRQEGHQLRPEDIEEVLSQKPEVLVVGTGDAGLMKVLPDTQHCLEAHGITLVAERTERACLIYNQLCQSKKVIAALHLTC